MALRFLSAPKRPEGLRQCLRLFLTNSSESLLHPSPLRPDIENSGNGGVGVDGMIFVEFQQELPLPKHPIGPRNKMEK